MSGWVKYPFHVRHNGVDYSPGEPIEVENPEGHVLRGAVEIVGMKAETAAKPTQAQSSSAARAGRRKAAK